MSSQKQWIPLVAILAILGFASLVFVLSLSDTETPSDSSTLAGLERAPVQTPTERPGSSTIRGPEILTPIPDETGLPGELDGEREYRNRIHGIITSARTEDRLSKAQVNLSEAPSFALVFQMGQGNGAVAPIQSVATDSQGRFQFFNVPAEKNLEITVSHGDHAHGKLTIGPIARVGDSEEYVIRLEEGFRIEGNVFDKISNAPIDKARMMVRPSNPMAMWMQSAGSEPQPGDKIALTDSGGFYEVVNAPKGAVDLVVQAEGYAEVRRTLHLNDTANPTLLDRQDFHLAPGSNISGRVETLEGLALADAHIMATSTTQNQSSNVSARTDVGGLFELQGLQDGEEYILRAMLNGYMHEGTSRHKAGEEDVVLKLSSTGRVVGRVVNGSTNRPLKRFTAAIIQFRRNVQPQPGANPGDTDDQRGGVLGTVDTTKATAQRPTPMGGLNAQPVIYSELRQTRREIQSRDGTFELMGITVAGEYMIKIEASGLAPQLSRPFTCNKGVTANVGDIVMGRGGSIEGRVQTSEGKAIAKARVFINCGGTDPSQNPIYKVLGPIGPQPLQRVSAQTDDEGRFRVDGLIPTTGVNIYVTKKGFSDGVSDLLVVRESEVTQVPTIVLKQGGTVFGLVLQDGVSPKAGTKVVLRPVAYTGGQLINREMVTGKPGKFRFEGIPEGKYKIYATPADPAGDPFGMILSMKRTEQEVEVFDATDTEVTITISTIITPLAPMRQNFPNNVQGERPVPKKPVQRKPVKPSKSPDEILDNPTKKGGDAGDADGTDG